MVNSEPDKGVMLKVGVSEALAPRLRFSECKPPGPSSSVPPIPAVVVQSKVAAILEVVVKCTGMPLWVRAMLSNNNLLFKFEYRFIIAENGAMQSRGSDTG